MDPAHFDTLTMSLDGPVATILIDNPPVNLMDANMIRDLARMARQLETSDHIAVVVVGSANPDFFIAHADVGVIVNMPTSPVSDEGRLTGIHRVFERWRTLPQATIAKIEGFARGGGSEFALSLDMRFAARGRAVLGQPEVGLGISPGAGGAARLAQLIGRARALELLLSGTDISADTAELYGYVNRALDPSEIDTYVTSLARRIATHPSPTVGAIKQSVDMSLPDPVPGLLAERAAFDDLRQSDEAQRRMSKFLEMDVQRPETEVDWGVIFDKLSPTGE